MEGLISIGTVGLIKAIMSFDKEKNQSFVRGIPFEISTKGAKVAIWIIPTDEEYMIAIDTQKLANK